LEEEKTDEVEVAAQKDEKGTKKKKTAESLNLEIFKYHWQN
jgi:hypothetical protein